MKHQGMINMVEADQEMPDDFIQTALKENSSAIGFVVTIADGERGIFKIDGDSSGQTTLEQVRAVDADYRDSARFYFFGKFPAEFHEGSIQPFPVLEDDDGETVMVCLMDGNFEEKAIADSKYSAEYDVFTKYIKPNITRIWKGADKEIHQTMEEIASDPSLPDLIKTWYKGRATILLLGSNGEYCMFGENALYTEYPWGWCSNPGTYGKQTIVEKAVSTVRGFGSRTVKGATVTGSPAPAAVPRNVTADSGSEAEKYHAPPLSATKKEKGEFYLEHNEGIIPPGYKECPKILKMEFRPIKTLADKRLGKAADAATNRPIADVVPARRATAATAAVTAEVLPVIPPTQLKKLAAFMKVDLVAKNVNEGRNILDPTRFAEFEKQYATFSQAAGLKGLEETFPWIFEAYVKLGKDVGIEALALLAFNLSVAYQSFLAAEDDGEKTVVNTEAVNDAPPVVKKASGFGSRKVN